MKCEACGRYVYYRLRDCYNCSIQKEATRKGKPLVPDKIRFGSPGGSQRRWQVEEDIKRRRANGDTDYIYPGRKAREDLRPRVD